MQEYPHSQALKNGLGMKLMQERRGEEEILPCRESENKAKNVSVHAEQIHSIFDFHAERT